MKMQAAKNEFDTLFKKNFPTMLLASENVLYMVAAATTGE